MKRPLFSVFIVASLMVAIAHCFPGGTKKEDTSDENDKDNLDTVLLLPGRNPFSFSRPSFQFPELTSFGDDDDDDDSAESYNPFKWNYNPLRNNPFGGMLDGFQSFMDRIQAQINGVLSGLPGQGIFGIRGGIPKGGNTTSTTKVIDGHVVTINETTYQSNDNDSSLVFRVHVVDVRPVNETDGNTSDVEIDLGAGEVEETLNTGVNLTPNKNDGTNEPTTQEPRSVETVEDLAGNEIPMKDQVDNFNA